MKQFIENYIERLSSLIQSIDQKNIIEIITTIQNTKGTIYIIGNGGSAATASHMVNDLGIGLKRRDINNFSIQSLADNTPVITAIANDIGYENIFHAQFLNKITNDDLIIAISCSGNSMNIIKAVQYAKEIGSTIIGMTGFHGGKLRQLSDINFHIDTPEGEYGPVEDLHMILDHIIYSYFISTTTKGNK